jgi:hypothetical protein
VSFAAITLCVASQRVIPKVSIYIIMDSVRKVLDTPSYDSYSILSNLLTQLSCILYTLVFYVTCFLYFNFIVF